MALLINFANVTYIKIYDSSVRLYFNDSSTAGMLELFGSDAQEVKDAIPYLIANNINMFCIGG